MDKVDRVVGLSNMPCPISVSFPQRLKALKRPNNHVEIYKLFEQIKISIPHLDAKKQIPAYAKFFKDLYTIKRTLNVYDKAFLIEQASSIIQIKIVSKYKDPGCLTISIVKGLGLGELKSTSVTLQLADHSIRIPRGGGEDVLVQVEKFYFSVDFVVLDKHPVANPETQIRVILGRPFLSTSDAFIQYRNGIIRLAFENMTLELNIFNVAKQSCLVAPFSLEYSLSPEIEYLYSLPDVTETCEVHGWEPRFEKLPPIEEKIFPSSVQTPKLELKPLPSTHKYAFLGKNETFLVVIFSSLEGSQEAKLLALLRVHRNAIKWAIANIKGYNQIEIALEDQENTTFTCPFGTFAYRQMPFGLYCHAPVKPRPSHLNKQLNAEKSN
ncbi:hypothetical protein Acr_07g0010080 [Actinidia rufa]|uniref:Uncharacterized protein n=1 Tax=Actinidia rufa TaxID=165716 RepID=A0A7J0EWF4_9ERIC|nr:hypothetical protein Acr_07g0010080 [Actinidia rufa]